MIAKVCDRESRRDLWFEKCLFFFFFFFCWLAMMVHIYHDNILIIEFLVTETQKHTILPIIEKVNILFNK